MFRVGRVGAYVRYNTRFKCRLNVLSLPILTLHLVPSFLLNFCIRTRYYLSTSGILIDLSDRMRSSSFITKKNKASNSRIQKHEAKS